MRGASIAFLITLSFLLSSIMLNTISRQAYAVDPMIGSEQSIQNADNNPEACTDSDACAIRIPTAEASGTVTQNIMKIVFAVAAVLSVIFVAIGGFKYTVSSGDPSGLQSAKNTILYAVIGLAISVSAYTIVQFVIGKV